MSAPVPAAFVRVLPGNARGTYRFEVVEVCGYGPRPRVKVRCASGCFLLERGDWGWASVGDGEPFAPVEDAPMLADRLRRDAQDYHDGVIDGVVHAARNRQTWLAIEAAGLRDRVAAALREARS